MFLYLLCSFHSEKKQGTGSWSLMDGSLAQGLRLHCFSKSLNNKVSLLKSRYLKLCLWYCFLLFWDLVSFPEMIWVSYELFPCFCNTLTRSWAPYLSHQFYFRTVCSGFTNVISWCPLVLSACAARFVSSGACSGWVRCERLRGETTYPEVNCLSAS